MITEVGNYPGYRIVATGMQGMTFYNPPYRKPGTTYKTMVFERFNGILRAGRRKPA